MDNDDNATMNNGGGNPQPTPPFESKEKSLVRLIKAIAVNPDKGRYVDESVVHPRYYNAFNYSLLPREHENVNLAIGITSPNPGDGKTLVACNLAVSLALGSRKNTALVDLNIANPRIHDIFGVTRSPGLVEAFNNGTIHVSKTSIDNLSVLAVGNPVQFKPSLPPISHNTPAHPLPALKPSLGLDKLAPFRDVIYSLGQEFEFVVVDMPAVNSEDIPVPFSNQLNGLIIVVDSNKTRREDILKMYHQISERQVIGFVLNRFKE